MPFCLVAAVLLALTKDSASSYVLPNSQLAVLARWAPQSRTALMSALNNAAAYPVVQARADELVGVIAGASQAASTLWEEKAAVADAAQATAPVVETVAASAPPSGAATPTGELEAMDVDVPPQPLLSLAGPVLTSLWTAVTGEREIPRRKSSR